MYVMRGAIFAVVLLSVGCSSGPDGRVEGPLLTSTGSANGGMAAIVAGPFTFRNGCLLLSGKPVVWPESTTWDAEREVLTLPNGDAASVGESLTGGGGFLDLSAVADQFGGNLADAAKRCLGSTGEVAVFNPGSDVEIES